MISRGAYAFEYPVPPDDVLEAYYLGQTSDHAKLANFYQRYIQHLPYPSSHPIAYVESVEFRTPYEQIVLRSQMHLNRQTALEADDEYQKNPGLVQVRIVVSFKAGYESVWQPPDLDRYKISVSQGKVIEPKGTPSTGICNPSSEGACTNLRVEFTLRFDAEQFRQGVTTVKVVTPEGQAFQTKFDLTRLK